MIGHEIHPGKWRTFARCQVVRGAHAINFQWLVTLRWGAIAGQATTILVVDRLMEIALPLTPLGCIVAVAALSNAGCEWWVRACLR